MKSTTRPLSLLVTLALCSIALGALTTTKSCTAPAPLSEVQSFASSGVDASVPPASTVTFPVGEESSAPTF